MLLGLLWRRHAAMGLLAVRNSRQTVSASRVATYLALGAWALVCGFPLYWLAITSIKSVADLDRPPSYIPFVDFMPSLASWRFILADPAENLLPSFVNSLLIGFAAALISLLFAGLAVYGLTRFPGRRRWGGLGDPHALMALMLSVRVVPPVVLALPIYILAGHVGLLDTRSLLVCVYAAINLPVALWLVAPVFGQRATRAGGGRTARWRLSHRNLLWHRAADDREAAGGDVGFSLHPVLE